MMEKELTEIQKKLLEMFDWFNRYCNENHLRYYCLGGTMLGAARHQGFIPWDDDIDVGLPRKDYEQLLNLLGGKKTDKYYLESYRQEKKDYVYSYAKLYNTNTTLVENTRYKTKRGIYLDIFPLDGMGRTREEAGRHYKTILPLLDLLAAKVCAVRKDRKFYKNAAIVLARLIPQCILSDNELIRKINERCKKMPFDKYEYIGNADGNWREKEIMERSIFGTPKLYRFNGLDVYGVSDADAYLTHMYGDWRKLPPAEKQVTHHDNLFIDLNRSYLDA